MRKLLICVASILSLPVPHIGHVARDRLLKGVNCLVLIASLCSGHIAHAAKDRAYRQRWWITWYSQYGLTANGPITRPGLAACGYDVALNTRVFIPGVGTVLCEDRPATRFGYHHADVWVANGWVARRMGLGSDYRLVTIYR